MDGRGILVRGYYRKRKDAIFKCALEAMRRNYRSFAVQHQGWCATGPKAHLTFGKYGRSKRCRNGKGGPWANDVYTITGRCWTFHRSLLCQTKNIFVIFYPQSAINVIFAQILQIYILDQKTYDGFRR